MISQPSQISELHKQGETLTQKVRVEGPERGLSGLSHLLPTKSKDLRLVPMTSMIGEG